MMNKNINFSSAKTTGDWINASFVYARQEFTGIFKHLLFIFLPCIMLLALFFILSVESSPLTPGSIFRTVFDYLYEAVNILISSMSLIIVIKYFKVREEGDKISPFEMGRYFLKKLFPLAIYVILPLALLFGLTFGVTVLLRSYSDASIFKILIDISLFLVLAPAIQMTAAIYFYENQPIARSIREYQRIFRGEHRRYILGLIFIGLFVLLIYYALTFLPGFISYYLDNFLTGFGLDLIYIQVGLDIIGKLGSLATFIIPIYLMAVYKSLKEQKDKSSLIADIDTLLSPKHNSEEK